MHACSAQACPLPPSPREGPSLQATRSCVLVRPCPLHAMRLTRACIAMVLPVRFGRSQQPLPLPSCPLPQARPSRCTEPPSPPYRGPPPPPRTPAGRLPRRPQRGRARRRRGTSVSVTAFCWAELAGPAAPCQRGIVPAPAPVSVLSRRNACRSFTPCHPRVCVKARVLDSACKASVVHPDHQPASMPTHLAPPPLVDYPSPLPTRCPDSPFSPSHPPQPLPSNTTSRRAQRSSVRQY